MTDSYSRYLVVDRGARRGCRRGYRLQLSMTLS
jgi:hypothetical protein